MKSLPTMTKHFYLAVLLFAGFIIAFAAAPWNGPPNTIDALDAVTIQARLDVGKTNNNPSGHDLTGQQVVTVGPKIIRLTKPLMITSAQTLSGQGHNTVLRWDGPPGSSAIIIESYLSHHYVKEVNITNLDIWCPNGADAVAIGPSAKFVADFLMSNVWVVGGRVNLPGENYFCTLDRVHFSEPRGQAIRMDGQGHLLKAVKVEGSIVGGAIPTSMVETHGSVTLSDWCQLEGTFPCPLLDAYDWNKWRGTVYVAGGAWFEPHSPTTQPTVRLTNVAYHAPAITGNWPPEHPWVLINSTLHVDTEMPNPTGSDDKAK